MKISNNQQTQYQVGVDKKSTREKKIDSDVLSVFMDNDAVSISSDKVDSQIPDKHWHFQLAEPTVSNAAKGFVMGTKGGPTSELSIIHTNDEHDPDFDKRFPKEATLIHQREKLHGDEKSVIVNTGDLTYESSNDKPGPRFFGPIAEVMKAEGIEYFVPGNHEFQHGGKYLEEEFLPKLDATTLLGNVTLKSEGKPLDHTKPFVIENINGVNVGIIGLTTPKQKTKAHPHVGFDVNVKSISQGAAELVPQVKKAGADVVVIIAHEGINRCVDAASSVPGIDVIVAGHDHQTVQEPKEVKNPDGGTTLVLEAGSHGKYVGDLSLELDTQSKKLVSLDYKLFDTSSVKPDPEVLAIIQRFQG